MATATTQVRSDDAIRSSVLFELKWEPKLTHPEDIAVAVKDGVVTLSGFAPSYWEKDAAEKAVKRVYGVRGVANDIKVKLPSERTDPEIARELLLAWNMQNFNPPLSERDALQMIESLREREINKHYWLGRPIAGGGDSE